MSQNLECRSSASALTFAVYVQGLSVACFCIFTSLEIVSVK